MSKKIKVYYIKHPPEDDRERGTEVWQRYLRMTTGYREEKEIPLKKDYRKVLEFELDNDIPENTILNKLWHDCQNLDYHENAVKHDRSMMVGDVIQIDEKVFTVASIGFTETEWY